MLKKILYLTLALGVVSAQEEFAPESEEQGGAEQPQEDAGEEASDKISGKCPELTGTMTLRGQKLDHPKLYGSWKTILVPKKRVEKADCWSAKIQTFEQANSTNQFQLMHGHNFKNVDADFTTGEVFKQDGFFFEDDQYITFSDKDDSARGALQVMEDIKDPDHSQMLEQLAKDMRTLTDEEKANMTAEDIEMHEDQKNYLDMIYPQIKEKILDASPFDNALQVLDTDYDNYVMLWQCKQEVERTNKEGQSQEEITYLKESEPDKEYDENFVNEAWTHEVQASIQVRSLDSKVFTEEKRKEYVDKLHAMAPGHDWSSGSHENVYHSSKCPAEDVDMFSLPGAQRFSELEGGDEGGSPMDGLEGAEPADEDADTMPDVSDLGGEDGEFEPPSDVDYASLEDAPMDDGPSHEAGDL